MRRASLSIGELARAAGVSVQAVRFYERRNLLPRAARTDSGHRRYTGDALERLHAIARAKEIGFTLAEIADILEARQRPNAACLDVCRAVRVKLDHVERQLVALATTRARLERLRDACTRVRPVADSPLIVEIEGRPRPRRKA